MMLKNIFNYNEKSFFMVIWDGKKLEKHDMAHNVAIKRNRES